MTAATLPNFKVLALLLSVALSDVAHGQPLGIMSGEDNVASNGLSLASSKDSDEILAKRMYDENGVYHPPHQLKSSGIQMRRVLEQDDFAYVPLSIRLGNNSSNRSPHNPQDGYDQRQYDQELYNTPVENPAWNELGHRAEVQAIERVPQSTSIHRNAPLYQAHDHRMSADNFSPNQMPSTIALAGVGALALNRYFRRTSNDVDDGASSSSSAQRPRRINSSRRLRRTRTGKRQRVPTNYEGDNQHGASDHSDKGEEDFHDAPELQVSEHVGDNLHEEFHDTCKIFSTDPLVGRRRATK